VPRNPRSKRIVTADGDFSVAAKNPNGDGSVYFEAAQAARCDRTYADAQQSLLPRHHRCRAHGLAAQLRRPSVTKEIERAAKIAGLDPTGLASHSGRRTVITALYADGRLDLADVARHVGHSDTATTAEYVRSLGQRPVDTARRAAELLDPTVSTRA
jgi:integrase